MRTLFLTAILIVGTIPAAGAATPTVPQRVSQPTPKHWLSDGLNRLVFWQVPLTARTARQIRD